MKRCTRCGVEKDESAFHRKAASKDGRQSACKACAMARQARFRQRPGYREHKRAYNAARRQDPAVRERLRECRRQWRRDPANGERKREHRAARKYRIPAEEVRRLRSLTHCQCCGGPLPANSKHRHIDHCHATGKVRGMVCRACNLTMHGDWRECIERMRRCIDYLEHNHQQEANHAAV